MKKLTETLEVLTNITESFRSDLVRKLLLGVSKKSRDSRFVRYMVAFDKIEDRDLVQLTREEAIKHMRSQKEPGYIFWHNSRRGRTDISYGYDIVMTYDGVQKNVKTIHFSEDNDEFYELLAPERYFVRELQNQRYKFRENAYALKTDYEIAAANRHRYKEQLAELQIQRSTSAIDEMVIKAITEYTDVLKNWIPRYIEKCQLGTPSYNDIYWTFHNLSANMDAIFDKAHFIINYSWDKMDVIRRLEDIMKKCDELKENIKKFENSIS